MSHLRVPMQTKTKIAIAFAGTVFVALLITLGDDFLSEELVLLFLLPFVPAGTILAERYIVAAIRRSTPPPERRLRRLLMSGSIFHCLLIGCYLYCTWPRTYEKAEAIEDIGYFVRTLEDVHPNLYDRTSKRAFTDSVESLRRKLPGRVAEGELFRDLCRLASLVEDAHTGNGGRYFLRRGNFLFRCIFPYRIRIEDDRIYVTGNYSYREEIPAGSEILRINGMTGAECLTEVSRLVSYETIPYRNALVANPVSIAFWNDFRDYVLEYRLPISGQVRSVRTRGGLYARIQFLRSLSEIGSPYHFSVIADSIGYIGFYRCSDPEGFQKFLRETFETVRRRGITSLIIDIRENGGGDSSLDDEFMQYISQKPFRTFDRVTLKLSSQIVSLYPEWKDSLKSAGSRLIEYPDLPLIPLRENPLRFKGNCMLLAGSNTFSSAAAFASEFRCFGVGPIAGAETGGITVCYGDNYQFSLPRTGFTFGVSWKKFTNACGVDDRRGVIPDYPMKGGLSWEEEGRDAVLELAVDLARRMEN
jgi:hypothetical protein